MLKVGGRHYRTAEPVEVTYEGGRITSLGPATGEVSGWLGPALFDLQINGSNGHGFGSPDLTPRKVREVVDVCRQHGVAGLCPTLVTGPFADLAHGFATIARACDQDSVVAGAVPGFHLEGPYISPEDGPRGAHPRAHVRPPDWDEFSRLQEAAGGRIRLVTLAPEYDESLAFIERLTASGVVVAIGHTAARPERIREAVRAGARLSTHLGNGAHAVLPRHPNYVWEQLAADELWASVIPDGHHLPDSVLKCIVRVKTPARTVVTCDASPLAGLPPGRYAQWDAELEVLPGGKVVVPGTPFLAGSGVFTDDCVSRAAAAAGVSLADAIDMASLRPRELLGLPPWGLGVGLPARLMRFDVAPDGALLVCEVLG